MKFIEIFSYVLAAISLTGTILNIKKVKYCFYIWAFTNAAWIVYDVLMLTWGRIPLDALHFVTAVWGIFSWSKKAKKEAKKEAQIGTKKEARIEAKTE